LVIFDIVKHLLIILLITLPTIPIYSQVDTLSSLDYLHKASLIKKQEVIHAKHILGCSIFVGLGVGGNDPKSGFSSGASARVHYNIHTVNIYTSLASKTEMINTSNNIHTPMIISMNTLQSSCKGITYGVGAYGKNMSGSVGIGIGYNQTVVYRPNIHVSGWPSTLMTYNEVGACVGGQLTFHGKYVGFTIQSYCNISRSIANYTALAGLELMLNDLIKQKPPN